MANCSVDDEATPSPPKASAASLAARASPNDLALRDEGDDSITCFKGSEALIWAVARLCVYEGGLKLEADRDGIHIENNGNNEFHEPHQGYRA